MVMSDTEKVLSNAVSAIERLTAQNQALMERLDAQLSGGNGVQVIAAKGNRGGSDRKDKHVLDTTTGIAYRTESGAGLAVASEYGFPLTITNKETGKVTRNSFVWFQVIGKAPSRFQHITEEQYLANPKKVGTVLVNLEGTPVATLVAPADVPAKPVTQPSAVLVSAPAPVAEKVVEAPKKIEESLSITDAMKEADAKVAGTAAAEAAKIAPTATVTSPKVNTPAPAHTNQNSGRRN